MAKAVAAPAAVEEQVFIPGFDGKETEFCPYNETSQSYDQTRAPLGLNIVLGSLSLGSTPLQEQRILDIGCGTGTFLKAVAGKVGEMTGIEYNDGMISQARELVGQTATLVQGSADSMPFEDESFDACVVNQVIHHFPKDDDYAFAKRSFQEAFRVLKPGGCYVLNTSMPEQQRDAFWWLSLFPKASDAQCSRFPPLEVVKKHLLSVGFEMDSDSVVVPLHRTLMASDKYLEHGVQGAFKAAYRAGDSSWSMSENFGELEGGLKQLQAMIDDGSAETWLAQREALRLSMGQATFITVRKPAARLQ